MDRDPVRLPVPALLLVEQTEGMAGLVDDGGYAGLRSEADRVPALREGRSGGNVSDTKPVQERLAAWTVSQALGPCPCVPVPVPEPVPDPFPTCGEPCRSPSAQRATSANDRSEHGSGTGTGTGSGTHGNGRFWIAEGGTSFPNAGSTRRIMPFLLVSTRAPPGPERSWTALV